MANPENLKPFVPGDPRINRKGRPRKLVSDVIKDLDAAGLEPVTKTQVVSAIETLLNCEKEELTEYANDEGHSMLIRILANHILNADDDDRIMQTILDRAFGKAQQSTDITTKGESINEIDYSKLSDSALDEILEAQSDYTGD